MASELQQSGKQDGFAVTSAQVDFSSVLARTIDSVRDDPAQLRNAIYELARIKLQREAWARSPPMSILETRRLMLALETAIERVETLSSQKDRGHLLKRQGRLLENLGSDVHAYVPDHRDSVLFFDPR